MSYCGIGRCVAQFRYRTLPSHIVGTLVRTLSVCASTSSSATKVVLPAASTQQLFMKMYSSSTKRTPKIYTRTGDGGKSSTFAGDRRPKDDQIFDALGSTDELSSYIGLARQYAMESSHSYVDRLERVQCILQDVSSAVATPRSQAREAHLKKTGFNSRHAKELETWIDEYSQQLPPLENFILPGGGKAASVLHVARAICRRAERNVTPLVRDEEVDKEAAIYLNRLSDFLFVVARLASRLDNCVETVYIRPQE